MIDVNNADAFATLSTVGEFLASPPSPLSLDDGVEVRELALLQSELPPEELDRVWAWIVVQARAGNSSWKVAAAWLALPLLRQVTSDADGQYLTLRRFLAALESIDVTLPGVLPRLIRGCIQGGA